MSRALVRWVQIEGWGDETSGRPYRLSTSLWGGDADGVYLPVLAREPFSGVGTRWDPRAAPASRATIGGVEVRLLATPEVCQGLLAQRAPARVAALQASISKTATSLTLTQISASDLSGQVVMVGREAVSLDSLTSSSGSDYTYTVTRGALGTYAQAHPVSASRDGSVFRPQARLLWPLLRVVTVGYSPVDGSGYGDEVVLGRFVLRGQPGLAGLGEVVVLSCDAALDLVAERRLLGDLWRGRLRRTSPPPDGALGPWTAEWEGELPASERTPSYGSSPSGGLFRVGDRSVAYTQWSSRSTPQGAREVRVQVSDTTELAPGSAPLPYDDAQGAGEVWEVFTTHPSAPALRSLGTATQQRLSANPVALARQLLTTTRAATLAGVGTNGDYDIGASLLGCAVPEALLDTAAWDDAEDQEGLRLVLWLGLDGQAQDALALVQTVLGCAGWACVPTQAGLLTLRRLRADDDGATALTGELAPRLQAQRLRLDDPLDEVTATWGVDPQGVRRVSFSDAATSERQLAKGAQLELSLAGVAERQEAWSLCVREVRTWRTPLLEVDLWVLLTPASEALSAGDMVELTSLVVLDPDGNRGVTGAVGQLLSVLPNYTAGRVDLTVLLTGALHDKLGRIAPAAIIASVGGLVLTLEANTFTGTPGPGANDSYGFEVGDVVRVLTRDGATVRGTATITAVNTGTPSITLGSVPAGTAAGDAVEPAPYTSSVARQTALWAYLDRDYEWAI